MELEVFSFVLLCEYTRLCGRERWSALYLGSIEAAKNVDLLDRHGIRLIIDCRGDGQNPLSRCLDQCNEQLQYPR